MRIHQRIQKTLLTREARARVQQLYIRSSGPYKRSTFGVVCYIHFAILSIEKVSDENESHRKRQRWKTAKARKRTRDEYFVGTWIVFLIITVGRICGIEEFSTEVGGRGGGVGGSCYDDVFDSVHYHLIGIFTWDQSQILLLYTTLAYQFGVSELNH